ncbi:MAG: hypothetical protein IT239_01640 [Bacteroidia bacterium]|nr:hypothetical protein [Bacteroidia bacterium]
MKIFLRISVWHRILFTTVGLLMIFFSINGYSQGRPYQPVKHSEKYFASFYYGEGRARWVSNVSYTDLYNPDGQLIEPSSIKTNFKIRNTSKTYGLDVSAPYGPLRLGLGIGFENFFLDKIILSSTSNKAYLPFNESFRFNKIGFTTEYPLPVFKEKRVSLNLLARTGYYGFNSVKSYNFFGGNYLGNTLFAGLGILGDIEIVPRYFLFIVLNGDYKYYRNSAKEMPSIIRHHIYTGSIQAGLRINMYEYEFVKRILLGKD